MREEEKIFSSDDVKKARDELVKVRNVKSVDTKDIKVSQKAELKDAILYFVADPSNENAIEAALAKLNDNNDKDSVVINAIFESLIL